MLEKIPFTVKIIDYLDTERGSLLTQLIKESSFCSLVDEGERPDFIIYLDINFLVDSKDKDKSISNLIEMQDCEDIKCVLDVSQDLFEDEKYGSITTLCATCAGFVLCSSSEMQEIIYEKTGRLAYIVDNPLTKESFKQPDSDCSKNLKRPKILWFGFPNEIFSIRKEQVENQTRSLDIDSVVMTKNLKQKTLDSAFRKADIVYLPKTFDAIDEQNRKSKVELALLEGKFVVAPDLIQENDIAFNGTLKQAIDFYKKNDIQKWITSKQNKLLLQEGINKSLSQIQKAFELGSEEISFLDIDCFLDSDEVFI